MNYLSKVSIVFLVVCSLILAQSSVLLAQTQAPSSSPEVPQIVLNLPPASAPTTVPATAPTPAPVPAPPKAADSSGATQHLGLITGVALTAVGVGLLVAGEPTHQTTCITYGICPVPGPVHLTGGILIGVGVPLTILKLVKH
jgi:hypothetical protein